MVRVKNLNRLSRRIVQAISDKETIILYADSDLDGTCAVIIIKQAILNLGGKEPVIYFCDRKREEYGINQEALLVLRNKAPALLLAVDCGTADGEEIETAKKMGFEVAILDHHEVLDVLPKADIIVNSKMEAKNSFFYDLSAAGLALELAIALLQKKFVGETKQGMIELSALATLSDMVPEKGRNKEILAKGLPLLETSWRPAIKTFFISNVVRNCISTREIAQTIIRIINVTSKVGDLSELYLFLNVATLDEAKLFLEKFLKKSAERQVKIEELVKEVIKKINAERQPLSVIFLGHSLWPLAFLGSVCSRVCEYFKKPSFIFSETEKEGRGHYHAPPGIDGFQALKSCSGLLNKYGGHAPVGGFSFKTENKDKLKQCLINYFQKKS